MNYGKRIVRNMIKELYFLFFYYVKFAVKLKIEFMIDEII